MLKLNVYTMLGASIGLLAAQILLPAFLPMSASQQTAVATFCQAAAAVLGLRGMYINPDGTDAIHPYRKDRQ